MIILDDGCYSGDLDLAPITLQDLMYPGRTEYITYICTFVEELWSHGGSEVRRPASEGRRCRAKCKVHNRWLGVRQGPAHPHLRAEAKANGAEFD